MAVFTNQTFTHLEQLELSPLDSYENCTFSSIGRLDGVLNYSGSTALRDISYVALSSATDLVTPSTLTITRSQVAGGSFAHFNCYVQDCLITSATFSGNYISLKGSRVLGSTFEKTDNSVLSLIADCVFKATCSLSGEPGPWSIYEVTSDIFRFLDGVLDTTISSSTFKDLRVTGNMENLNAGGALVIAFTPGTVIGTSNICPRVSSESAGSFSPILLPNSQNEFFLGYHYGILPTLSNYGDINVREMSGVKQNNATEEHSIARGGNGAAIRNSSLPGCFIGGSSCSGTDLSYSLSPTSSSFSLGKGSLAVSKDFSTSSSVSLSGSSLYNSVGLGSFGIADLCLIDVNFTGRDFSNHFFKNCDLRGALFTNCDLTSASFYNCDLRGADFTGATLTDAVAKGCRGSFSEINDRFANRLAAYTPWSDIRSPYVLPAGEGKLSLPLPDVTLTINVTGAAFSVYLDSFYQAQIASAQHLASGIPLVYTPNVSGRFYINTFSNNSITLEASLTYTDSRDGEVYPVVSIGTQTWMARNFAYDPGADSWFYNNDSLNKDTYGRLYTTSAALTVAPPGWHLPTQAEVETLLAFVGGSSTAGTKLRSATDWVLGIQGTDDYGFNFKGGGYTTGVGFFDQLNTLGYMLTSTEVDATNQQCYYMYNLVDSVTPAGLPKTRGYSVRLIKD